MTKHLFAHLTSDCTAADDVSTLDPNGFSAVAGAAI